MATQENSGLSAMVTRAQLMESYGVTEALVLGWEKEGLAVYGGGRTRLYDVAEVVAFIKCHPIKRKRTDAAA